MRGGLAELRSWRAASACLTPHRYRLRFELHNRLGSDSGGVSVSGVVFAVTHSSSYRTRGFSRRATLTPQRLNGSVA